MFSLFRPFSFLFLFIHVTLAAAQTDASTMIWLSEGNPEADKAITLDEALRDLIISGIDDIHFEIQKTNAQRAMLQLKTSPNVCVSDKIYSPARQAFSLASDLPQVVVPGLRLYLSQAQSDDVRRFLADQSAPSLHDIMSRFTTLNIALVKGRSYGSELDTLFSRSEWQDRIWRRSSADMGSGVVSMMVNGRVDATVEYPVVVSHYLEKQGMSSPFLSLSVKETPDYVTGYVLCSRSAEGQRAIQRISARIAALSKTTAYLQPHLHWFDSTLHQDITRYYNTVYGTDLGQQKEQKIR
ncbi:hypothetical protein [Alteromonas sp. CYL-A6]|uniref:hypothetical protein n=1 Tax=Alteromonas nitratireducens TaxID=3390813 RepID=UPI0034B3EC2E